MTIISVIIGNFITIVCLALIKKFYFDKKFAEDDDKFLDKLGDAIADKIKK